ncbi:MAG: peroxide stress protein YaaA [Burkholderiaceae bacterium]
MLILLSPAKTLDFDSPLPRSAQELSLTEPALMPQATQLAKVLKPMSPADLEKLMGISPKLADLNAQRFSSWSATPKPSAVRPAVFAFNGDVYEGLQASTLTKAQLEDAQSRLRMLSGLYGLLRPMDAFQAYRLEMGTPLKARAAGKAFSSLYDYWGASLVEALGQDLAALGASPLVLNLASDEYFKAAQGLQKHQVNGKPVQVISPVFQDEKSGKYKIISFYAKRARGLMARYVLQKRVRKPEQLQGFDLEGYRFYAQDSTPLKPVFRRTEADAKLNASSGE